MLKIKKKKKKNFEEILKKLCDISWMDYFF